MASAAWGRVSLPQDITKLSLAEVLMSNTLSKRLSRRKFLLSTGGVALFTAIATSSLAAPRYAEAVNDYVPTSTEDQSASQAIEVLYHEEVQEGAAFGR